MPTEEQNNAADGGPAAGKAKIAIRTMKSDVDEFFKSTRPTLSAMIGQEQATAAELPRKRKKLPLLVFAGIAALAAVGAGLFFIPRFLPGAAMPPAETGVQKLIPPPPFFATETSRTINADTNDRAQFLELMRDSWQEAEREGTAKRIVIKLKDGSQERFATLTDFFNLWRIMPPPSLLTQIDPQLMVFISYGHTGGRLGFAVRTNSPDRTLADMLSWEPALLTAFNPFFFSEKMTNTLFATFEDRTYRNIDWRYLKLSQDKDLGIGYAIFPAGNVLLMTTSKETMETAINRLFDAR
ncbi:MAG: hypothetical protein HY221_00890 [Candidatus Sungbacteria bacterium]|uniref:Uncharacterized protein n=1 Tax=Candidatus Sungiibacteriota bacterium TaxID=2750080 RepID=A0A932R1B2_9BACT|nr:hypothetical protein [Candidatus Sungbacteria bacterium]